MTEDFYQQHNQGIYVQRVACEQTNRIGIHAVAWLEGLEWVQCHI